VNTIQCPVCEGHNTRRIQNELAKIPEPVFYQGPEWLGYCHDCGTLYEYYGDKILNNPSIRDSYDENQSAGGLIVDEPVVNTKDGFWKGLHFFGFGKRKEVEK